jgi:hypothetical protein
LPDLHPATAAVLRWFEYDHLPEHLKPISQMLHDVAHEMARRFPDGGAELTAGLRKLLEGKDCLVRVAVAAHETGEASEAEEAESASPSSSTVWAAGQSYANATATYPVATTVPTTATNTIIWNPKQ